MRPSVGVRRLRAYRPAERALLLRASLSIALVELRLRFTSFTSTLAWAGSGPVGRALQPDDLDRARRYARWVDVAARHHPARARCLHRSLVLHRWLRTEGLPSTLRIGIRLADGRFDAHAWVELGGAVMNDWPERVAAFVPLAAFGADGSATDDRRHTLSLLRSARWR